MAFCTEPHCVNICTVTVNYFEMRMRIHWYKRFLYPEAGYIGNATNINHLPH